MIFPNIQVFDKENSVYFCDELSEKTPCKLSFNYKTILNKYSDNIGIIQISQPVQNLDKISNYVFKKNYSRVIFTIDDVFKESIFRDVGAGLNRDYSNLEFKELDLISSLVDKSKITNFNVFHCEDLKNYILNSKYNFDIGYYDNFLSNFIYNKLQWSYTKTVTKKFTRKVSCLSNRFDYHRALITSLIYDKNDVIYTFNDTLETEKDRKYLPGIIKGFDKEYQDIFNNKLNKLLDLEKNKEVLENSTQHSLHPYNIIRKGFVNIIPETTFSPPYNYLSEKTFKPMMVYRPFIMLGPYGNLKLLKSLGFKTFDQWWDESYDLEKDNSKRIVKVHKLIDNILRYSYRDLQKMFDEMIPTLEYNRNHISYLPTFFINKLTAVLSN